MLFVFNQRGDLVDIQAWWEYRKVIVTLKMFKRSHGYLAFETSLSAYLTVVLHCVDVTSSTQA